jgi:predicted helicase
MSKSETNRKKARIFYARVDEFWRKGAKYAYLEEKQHVGNIEWQELQPDAKHNWLTEGMRDEFEGFIPVGSKEAKANGSASSKTIFKTFSGGLKTNRDVWTYNYNQEVLVENIVRFIDAYNEHVYKWSRSKDQTANIDDFVIYDEKSISWSRDLKLDLQRGKLAEFTEEKVRKALYRPFAKPYLFFDRVLNEEVYGLPTIFPASIEDANQAICLAGLGDRKGVGSLITNNIPSLDLAFEKAQCFPFYTYNEDGTNRRENITDWALGKFREHYGDLSITKWDIFHYVYAVLHHVVYRERYAANLKRELPRIPFVGDSKTFRAFAEAGARLSEIHVHYEQQPEYPLERIEQEGVALNWRVERMKLGKDKRSLRYNEFLTLDGIPLDAFEYRLGNRSALEWVIDQYQVTTDKRSGITNDPNRADDSAYILRLIGQVITVSLETVRIVRALPALGIDELP